MIGVKSLTIYTMFLPLFTAILSVVARNPIHAILGLISTFLLTCGLLFSHFKLGFSTSLIIIVYIGAIAILFLFIVMLIPIKERVTEKLGVKRVVGQFGALVLLYFGAGRMLAKHVIASNVNTSSEFGVRFANLLDSQQVFQHLSTNEREGLRLTDLYLDDIAIYGVQLYQEYAFAIMLVGAILLFVLVAAIMVCKED